METVLRDLGELITNKVPLGPEKWLEAAQYLNFFLEDETNLLFTLEQEVAKKKVELIEADPKKNVSRATVMVEATDEYKKAQMQRARIEQIKEFILISKKQATMASDIIKGN